MSFVLFVKLNVIFYEIMVNLSNILHAALHFFKSEKKKFDNLTVFFFFFLDVCV